MAKMKKMTKPQLQALAGMPQKRETPVMTSRVIASSAQGVELHVPQPNVVIINIEGRTLQVPMEQWIEWNKFVESQVESFKSKENDNDPSA